MFFLDYQFALLSWILFFTSGIGIFVAVVAWRKRNTPTAQYLALLEAGVVLWAFTAALEAAASTIPLKLLWSQISYLGITGTIASYFFLAIAYGQHSKYLTPRYISLILIIPILTIFAVATNNWHHSFYTDISINPSNNIAIYEHGFLFWIYTIYAYSLLVIGFVILFRAILRFPAIYKSQSIILIIGAILPFTGNVMYVFNLNPIPGVDWTPIAFGLSGLIFAWGIFRYRLLDLIPVARHKLVEAMNDGVLVIDAQGRIADFNPAMQAITGIPAKQALGQVATQALAHWEELIDCLKNNTECQIEISSVTGEAEYYYDLQISMIYNRRGLLSGKLIMLRNITKRMQTEESLRVSEEKFRNISTLAQDAILMMNPHKNISYWNKAAERIFGYKQKDVLGKDLHQLIVPSRYHDQFKQGFRGFQKNGLGAAIGETVELVAMHQSGEEFPVAMSLSSVQIEGEWNAIGIVRDISARKQTENALREANSLKETLLDIIVHDLKNPICVIGGMAELMLEDHPDFEMLEIIKNSSDQMVQVMDNATVLSQIALGDEIEKDEINITEILQSVAKEFSSQLDHYGMTLKINLPDTILIQANSIISEVFKNYISNAIKYATEGKKIIVDSNESDQFLVINVKDSGAIIPEKIRPNIFERSFQKNTKIPGRGLGLSIVKKIAIAHNAEVGVKPNKPKGNIFYIKIPIK